LSCTVLPCPLFSFSLRHGAMDLFGMDRFSSGAVIMHVRNMYNESSVDKKKGSRHRTGKGGRERERKWKRKRKWKRNDCTCSRRRRGEEEMDLLCMCCTYVARGYQGRNHISTPWRHLPVCTNCPTSSFCTIYILGKSRERVIGKLLQIRVGHSARFDGTCC
jgi:hypothetical protein